MCRWLAYSGAPIPPSWLVVDPDRSLVEQSRKALYPSPFINADGFGLAWWADDADTPGLYRTTEPAWSDQNLREICARVRSSMFLAHVRAATGTVVQQTNSHPFRHGRFSFVHNGFINEFARLRRDLLLAVDPSLFEGVLGSTDSELMFFLALTFGLEDDPVAGLERMVGFVERTAVRHGVPDAMQMTVAVGDGERLWAARYATGTILNTLFVSQDAEAVHQLHPDRQRLAAMGPEARAIVSEPVLELEGLWQEVEVGTAFVVQPGPDEVRPFVPAAP